MVGLPLIVWVLSALFSHNSYGARGPSLARFGLPPAEAHGLTAKVLANSTYSGGLAAALFFVLSFAGGGTSLSAYVATLPYGVLRILP